MDQVAKQRVMWAEEISRSPNWVEAGDHLKYEHTNPHKWGRAYRTGSGGRSHFFSEKPVPLKSLYTNTHNVKQRGGIRCLCAVTGLQSHQDYANIVGKFTRLECCSGRNSLLRNDKPGRWEVVVALYVTVQYDCMELYLGMGDKLMSQD